MWRPRKIPVAQKKSADHDFSSRVSRAEARDAVAFSRSHAFPERRLVTVAISPSHLVKDFLYGVEVFFCAPLCLHAIIINASGFF